MDIIEKVTELISTPVIEAGYIIESIEYLKEDGNQFLRVSIGKNGIIDVEDCVVVSKIINPILDEADPIEEEYILDVCSYEKGCE